MREALVFFCSNLKPVELSAFVLLVVLHVQAHVSELNAEKKLLKSIPKILSNPNELESNGELISILLTNVGCLALYLGTMCLIETLGKLAVRNAFDATSAKLLRVDTTKYDKATYEHEMASLVHHRENLISAVKNLFVEFPRKFVSCLHFLVALYELSFQVVCYCVVANCIFLIASVIISIFRKKINAQLIEEDIRSSLTCINAGRSIASHKVDGRIQEFSSAVSSINRRVWLLSSYDSCLVALNEAASGFSGQFMIALISYVCRPLVLSQQIAVEDLMYGVRSSAKFVEKLAGMMGYFEEVIRQYKSFHFFTGHTSKISTEVEATPRHLDAIRLFDGASTTHEFSLLQESGGGGGNAHFIRLGGPNGVGKTTALNAFLGPRFREAKTAARLEGVNKENKGGGGDVLLPTSYRERLGFAQQMVPQTEDTVESYVAAVCKYPLHQDPIKELQNTLSTWLRLNEEEQKRTVGASDNTDQQKKKREAYAGLVTFLKSIPARQRIADLSGGQAKMIQILAAIAKIRNEVPKVLILDEPTNNLDKEKVGFLKVLFGALKKSHVTVFMVTHTDELAEEAGFQTVNIAPRKPEQLDEPESW